MDSNHTQVRKMAETRLLMRALEDRDFHRRLLTDPRAAFEEEMGVPFPAIAKLQVIEEPADTVLLVVPKLPMAEGELSDAELDRIAGGLTMEDVNRALGDAWRAVKKAIGGGSFEVSTERAVAGVRG